MAEPNAVLLDKLNLFNHGYLKRAAILLFHEEPDGWTLEKLTEKHASSPFNPDIANAFFRAAYLESWGRGIDLIRNACKESGAPDPLFRWDNGLWVEFPFPAEPKGVKAEGTTQETTQEQILRLLRLQPSITRKELAEKISLSSDGIKYHLAKLKSTGVIRHTGSTKAGRWEVLK